VEFIAKKTALHFQRAVDTTPSTFPDIWPIRLVMAISKADAMEAVIQKAVELGAEAILPFFAEHSVVRMGNKSTDDFGKRWQRIATAALKQSGRRHELKITDPAKNLATALAVISKLTPENTGQFYFCDEQLPALPTNSLAKKLQEFDADKTSLLLIGPEGGWSTTERQLLQNSSWQAVSLGTQTLRVATAVLFAASLLVGAYQNGKKELENPQ
jgi:16S rRNA (uracil1498-N3)-methyltransferase